MYTVVYYEYVERIVCGTFDDYFEAKRAVDFLNAYHNRRDCVRFIIEEPKAKSLVDFFLELDSDDLEFDTEVLDRVAEAKAQLVTSTDKIVGIVLPYYIGVGKSLHAYFFSISGEHYCVVLLEDVVTKDDGSHAFMYMNGVEELVTVMEEEDKEENKEPHFDYGVQDYHKTAHKLWGYTRLKDYLAWEYL